MKVKIICNEENREKYTQIFKNAGFEISEDCTHVFKEVDYQPTFINGYNDEDQLLRIPVEDIYLIESYGNTVLLHTSKSTYRVLYKLYEVESLFPNSELIRVNKSQIISLMKIDKVYPQFNSRLKVSLYNNMIIYVSRTYINLFKNKIYGR